jgi:hypothetical protein
MLERIHKKHEKDTQPQTKEKITAIWEHIETLYIIMVQAWF